MNKYDEKTTLELLHETYWYVQNVDAQARKCMDAHEIGETHDGPCYGNDVIAFRADNSKLMAAIARRAIVATQDEE